jgi:hypothetical protein
LLIFSGILEKKEEKMAEKIPEMKKKEIKIQLDENTAQGAYVNLALVTHRETEFIFDFLFLQPQAPQAKVRARIITSPLHAKRFLKALEENVKKYEAKFGRLPEVRGEIQRPIGFA